MATLYKSDIRGFDGLLQAIRGDFIRYSDPVNVGEWQAIRSSIPQTRTLELQDVTIELENMPYFREDAQKLIVPNLPWAEDHFMERVSGKPYNPPPSHEWWPFNQSQNEEHRRNGKFSHTYPERFWPRHAGVNGLTHPEHQGWHNKGIRFAYGDFSTLIELLRDRPMTRQAFLPIWFPEDLQAASEGERVPCTLGYHFLIREGLLKIVYYIRSCDFRRHLRDDIYMAIRLAQFVAHQVSQEWVEAAGHESAVEELKPGNFVMHISSLHIFEDELPAVDMEYRTEVTQQLSKGV